MSKRSHRDRRLTIGGLVGSAVHTAEGRILGHVVDIELSSPPAYRVRKLLYGEAAWLYRLHVLHPLAEKLGIHPAFSSIPWEDIAAIERFAVVLKPRHERPPLETERPRKEPATRRP